MTITRKINILIVTSLLVLGISITLISIFFIMKNGRQEIENVRTMLLKERRTQVMDLVSNAFSVLETANYYEDAQKAIGSMRFGTGKNNYFFILDTDGMFFVHPEQPELIGRVHLDMKDAAGVSFVKNIIAVAKEKGEGFIEYQWTRPGRTTAGRKLAYIKLFKDWNWILCTGIYMDDVDHILNQKTTKIHASMNLQIRWLTSVILAFLVFSIMISRRVAGKISAPILHTIGLLKATSKQITSASRQTSDISQALAENAAQQATAMQATSDCLTEMAVMTSQNAGNADTTGRLVHETRNHMMESNRALEKLTDSMDQISNAGEQTRSIIKIIDGIAFQTNILALNASVEAARAGEYGSSFAVVADEFRNLALNVASSARDISAIINNTVEMVNNGSHLLGKAEKNFQNVEKNSAAIEELITQMSSACIDQTRDIDTVKRALKQIIQINDQNRHQSESSAQASCEMNIHAQAMHAAVDTLADLTAQSARSSSDTPVSLEPEPQNRYETSIEAGTFAKNEK